MITRALVTSLVFIGFVSPAFAAKPPKGGGKPRPEKNQAGPPSGLPSAQLLWFFSKYLDSILGPLDQRIGLPREELTHLRESFIYQYAKAPSIEEPAYTAALAVCDALGQAMDQREKLAAGLKGSAAPKDASSSPIDSHQKRHEKQNHKHKAAQQESSLTTQLKNQWTQRALQLRQQIDQLCTREREAERGSPQPTPTVGGFATSPVAKETITLDRPVQVKVPYGMATIPAGSTLPIVRRDANGIVVQFAGENVTLPP